MSRRFTPAAMRASLALALQALRAWTRRQFLVAIVVSIGFALLVGFVTVLIPNSVFARDIDTIWWNYPVWILTSAGAGMLTATYVTPGAPAAERTRTQGAKPQIPGAQVPASHTPEAQKTARMGVVGGVLAWFAVGCPVCNKIALLAFGYSGAITWFAPFQPVLAIAAMLLTGVALVWRLNGQVACAVPLPAATYTQPHRQDQQHEPKLQNQLNQQKGNRA